MPIWKLKPTELPQKPWYAEDLSLKRSRNGKLLDEMGAKKQEENEKKLKDMYDPLRVMISIPINAQDIQNQAEKQKQLQKQLQEEAQRSVSLLEEDRDVLKSRVLQQPSDIQAPKEAPATSSTASLYKLQLQHQHRHHHHHHSHSHSHSPNQNHSHSHSHSHKKSPSAIITLIDDSLYLKKEKEMQRLREERLKRETEERKRTTSLLIQHLKQSTVCSQTQQFNKFRHCSTSWSLYSLYPDSVIVATSILVLVIASFMTCLSVDKAILIPSCKLRFYMRACKALLQVYTGLSACQ